MDISPKNNPHVEFFDHAIVTYYTGNKACGKNDDWDNAYIRSGGSASIKVERKNVPEFLELLRYAHAHGKRNKAQEIRKTLYLD